MHGQLETVLINTKKQKQMKNKIT